MKISFDTKGLSAVQARLRGLAENKIKAAAKGALNVAAREAAEATKKEMASVFKNPTPWVLGGVRYKKATTEKLEAQVDFDQWGNKTNVTVSHVLAAEISGGNRKHKRHEVALQRAGILPSGYYIVPGQGADLDAYSNMKGAQIVQIMAWFSSFGEQGYRANMSDQTRKRRMKGTANRAGFEYFVASPGAVRTWTRSNGQAGRHKMQPGIYKRYFLGAGSMIKPVMIFVRSPLYRKRLDFYGTAERVARQSFDKAFSDYLSTMLKERGL